MSDKKPDIPRPMNLKPGDDFYEKTGIGQSSASSGQKMMFEPAAELIELPSHGYLYKDITYDPDILEKGAIRVRPMTVHEEKILTTSRLVKSGQALDMVFQNVIKSKGKGGTNLDPQLLLSSDRVYIMLWLRSVSYGNIYKFQLTCSNSVCQKRFEYQVDLSTHAITEMTDPATIEPFEFELPMSHYKLTFRLPRGKDESEVIKLQNQPKKINDTDETIVRRLSSCVFKVIDKDGAELPAQHKDFFIESMLGGDASAFRDELNRVDAGIEDIKNIHCPHCDLEFDTAIPITESFFRRT